MGKNIIALIPARSGSKRVPGKNIRELAGHPLLAYTIQVAKDSGLFGEHIYVSSDSDEYLAIAERYGARGILRPESQGLDESPDSEWISSALEYTKIQGINVDCFFILRPTSPFRTAQMLHDSFQMHGGGRGDILKAVEMVKQHPFKMWRAGNSDGYCLRPYAAAYVGGGYHFNQSNTFPALWVQNGSLEIRGINCDSTDLITPYYMHSGYEGLDINTELDFLMAEMLVERGLAKLPEIK